MSSVSSGVVVGDAEAEERRIASLPTLKEFLNITAAFSSNAVDLDLKGEAEMARAMYKDVISRLSAAIPFLPAEHRTVLQEKCLTYQRRVKFLEPCHVESEELLQESSSSLGPIPATSGSASGSREVSSSSPVPATQTITTSSAVPQQTGAVTAVPSGSAALPRFVPPATFVEEEISKDLFVGPDPEYPVTHPLWLIGRFCDSIQRGSLISPHIYVPAAAWLRANELLDQLSVKSEFLDKVCSTLTQLRGSDYPPSEDIVKETLKSLHSHRIALAKHIPGMLFPGDPQGPLSKFKGKLLQIGHSIVKKTTRLVSSRSKDTSAGYMDSIVQLAHVVAFLDQLLADCFGGRLDADRAVKFHQLEEMSDFLRRTVCVFILKDVQKLLDKYMTLSREKFSRLGLK